VIRKVALKIIKLGMDTKQVVGRFEAERQALALMDHPNIARVLEAGATETGRPYFVMELVRGNKITDYCDENNFPTRQRLSLGWGTNNNVSNFVVLCAVSNYPVLDSFNRLWGVAPGCNWAAAKAFDDAGHGTWEDAGAAVDDLVANR